MYLLHRLPVLWLLSLNLLLPGCAPKNGVQPGQPQPQDPKESLRTAAKALDEISAAAAAAADITLELGTAKTITREDRDTVLHVLRKVAQASTEGFLVVKKLDKLDTTDKHTLSVMLKPAFDAFHSALNSGLIYTRSATAKDRISRYITTISLGITVIETVLGVRR